MLHICHQWKASYFITYFTMLDEPTTTGLELQCTSDPHVTSLRANPTYYTFLVTL